MRNDNRARSFDALDLSCAADDGLISDSLALLSALSAMSRKPRRRLLARDPFYFLLFLPRETCGIHGG
jgi:hypothetical protein